MGFWILIFLIVIMTMAVPWWPYSRQWGYFPGTGLLVLLIIWILLLWLGMVTFYWPWVGPVTA